MQKYTLETVGGQIVETVETHDGLDGAVEAFERVGWARFDGGEWNPAGGYWDIRSGRVPLRIRRK